MAERSEVHAFQFLSIVSEACGDGLMGRADNQLSIFVYCFSILGFPLSSSPQFMLSIFVYCFVQGMTNGEASLDTSTFNFCLLFQVDNLPSLKNPDIPFNFCLLFRRSPVADSLRPLSPWPFNFCLLFLDRYAPPSVLILVEYIAFNFCLLFPAERSRLI